MTNQWIERRKKDQYYKLAKLRGYRSRAAYKLLQTNRTYNLILPGQRVRDKEGLAYSCTSFLNAGLQGGNWTALAGVNPKNVDRAMNLMEEEVRRVIEEPVTEQELDDAKENQIGSALMELESTEGIARTSHNLVHFGLGLDYFARRQQLFRKIGASQLQEMAGNYLQPSQTSSVIVGPKAKG